MSYLKKQKKDAKFSLLDTSVSYYLCHIVKALTKRAYSILNKTRKNVVVTNPNGIAQVCHTSKNRKKTQNLV